MSQGNVEIVREAYSRYSEGGFEAMMEMASADVEFEVSDVMPDMGGIHGREAAEPLFRSYAEMFDDFHITLEEVVASDGEKVVTAARDGGRIKGSDAEVRNRFFHAFTIRNGEIVRWSSHVERSRALEAAGLSE
jgi:ketosteroid isomerase-like protein